MTHSLSVTATCLEAIGVITHAVAGAAMRMSVNRAIKKILS